MSQHCAEGTALLAAVHADLADDTVRLVYADYLEEHDDPDRAEFIRLQIQIEAARSVRELSRKLFKRERELLTLHEEKWRSVAPCPHCKPHADCSTCGGSRDIGHLTGAIGHRWTYPVAFRRGFVAQVTATMNQVMTQGDTGYGASPMRGPDVGRVPERGFPCTCTWSFEIHGYFCPEHGKRGNPVSAWPISPAARAWVREFPTIEMIRLIDRSPQHAPAPSMARGWDFWMAWTPMRHHDVYLPLWRNLLPYVPDDNIAQHGWYADRATADKALARAVVKTVRDQLTEEETRNARPEPDPGPAGSPARGLGARP